MFSPLIDGRPVNGPSLADTAPDVEALCDRLEGALRPARRWLVITGAGISAASGIPTYRDDSGAWLRSDPVQHQDFVESAATRRRYWARSMVGWPLVADARPNSAHHALAQLEAQGKMALLVTQNVDRLHQQAGHRRVIDLHGRLDRVRCRCCRRLLSRSGLQQRLLALNPGFHAICATARPDGDAEIDAEQLQDFNVPACCHCGGVLMPDVVFFGGSVPRRRVANINALLHQSEAVVVAGSSLAVFSGFRFCRLARELGKPLIVINRGSTRADSIATLKLPLDCGSALQQLAARLA